MLLVNMSLKVNFDLAFVLLQIKRCRFIGNSILLEIPFFHVESSFTFQFHVTVYFLSDRK